MISIRNGLLTAAVLTLTAPLAGCIEAEFTAPNIAYVDSLYALDLETGHQKTIMYATDDDWEQLEPIFLDGCEITAAGLPAGAMIEGIQLLWSPTEGQIGSHPIHLRFGPGCAALTDNVGEDLEILVVEEKQDFHYGSGEGVHDLEKCDPEFGCNNG